MPLGDVLIKVGLDLRSFDADFKKVTSGFTTLSSKLSSTGKDLTAGLTVPIGAAAAAFVLVGETFDEAMDTIRAKTGKVGPELTGLTTSFKAVFASVPTSAGAAAEAISVLSSRLGLSGKPLEDLTGQLLNLARITGQDLAPLVDNVTRVFRDWSIKTEDQAGALDFLHKAAQATGTTVTGLSETVVKFGAPLRQLGFGFEESALLAAKFKAEGVNTELVMGSLRIALGKLAKEGIAEPGAAFEILAQRIRDAGSAGERNTLAIAAFGKKAGPDMAAAIHEGRFEVDQLLKTLQKSPESVSSATKATDGFSEQLAIVKQRAMLAAEPIGTALVQALGKLLDKSKPLLDWLTGVAKGFADLDPKWQATIIGVAGVAAAIGPLIVVVGMLSGSITSIIGTVGSVSTAIGSLTSVLGSGAGLAGLLSIATPLAIAFGVALAGWVLFKAISELQAINKELERLEDLHERGVKASADQAKEIRILEQAIDAHNKVIGNQKIKVDQTGKSLEQYIAALREAAKGIDKFRGSTDELIPSTKRLSVEQETLTDRERRLAGETGALRAQLEALGKGTDKTKEEVQKFHDVLIEEQMRRYNARTQELAKSIIDMREHMDKAAKSGKDWTDEAIAGAAAISAQGVAVTDLASGKIPLLIAQTAQVTKETSGLSEAFKTLGIRSSTDYQTVADEAVKARDAVLGSGLATDFEKKSAVYRALKAQIEAAKVSGEEIPRSQTELLEKLQKELDLGVDKQVDSWERLTKQVSTIVSDLGKDLAAGTVSLFKGLFGFDDFNKTLTQDSIKLRSELDDRSKAIEDFRQQTDETIGSITAKYAARLDLETGELKNSLAERKKDYDSFVGDVSKKLEDLHSAEGKRLVKEQSDLADRLADKVRDYEQYANDVSDKESAIRESHASRLSEELRDLRESLAERVEAYDDFLADTTTRLERAQGDLNEVISDASRGTNRRMEDENEDFARDTVRLSEEIRRAEARNDQQRVRDLRRSLSERQRDHEKLIRRLQEDLAEQVSDARQKSEEQTADLQTALQRRARDHQQYLDLNARAQDEATTKHRTQQAQQLADLQKSLAERAEALRVFRDTTAAALEAAAQRSAERIAEQEEVLRVSLQKRIDELNAYEVKVGDQIAALTVKHNDSLAEEVAKLTESLAERLSEYDKYRLGVEQKLQELEDAHKGPLDRIKELFSNVFESAANAILRLASEEVIGKLVGKLKSLIVDIFPQLGSAVAGIFGGTVGSIGSGLPGAIGGGAIPGVSFPGAPGGAAGAGAGSSLGGAMGIANLVTGIGSLVSSVFGNLQTAAINKSLDLIEHEVRFSQIHLLYILENTNRWLPNLFGINEYLWKVQADLLGQINTNILDGMNIWLERIDTLLRKHALPVWEETRDALIGSGGRPEITINVDGNVIGNNDFINQLANAVAQKLRTQGALA